jgi:2-polyprenyl-3-methyl-5-hydroxy-6-metoxy-1,4-benzoquinol methylase
MSYRDPSSLESFLANVRRRVLDEAPDLLPLFEIYAGEARFGASVIESDLRNLSSGSQILEVGAGMLLLSCHLQREEYSVTAVEPVGRGFSFLDRLRKIVMDCANTVCDSC